jgi:Flp pilus assembly pilin Flp
MFQRLWRDQRGFVNTTDVILLTTVLALGAVVGLASLRNQVVQEFEDIGSAVGALSQGYSYEGWDDTRQNDYFTTNFPTLDLSWLGSYETNGSSYTDNPNADGALTFPAPTPENTTPGED